MDAPVSPIAREARLEALAKKNRLAAEPFRSQHIIVVSKAVQKTAKDKKTPPALSQVREAFLFYEFFRIVRASDSTYRLFALHHKARRRTP